MTLQEKGRKFYKKMRAVLPDWINFQNLIFLTVIAAFFIIVVWSESMSAHFESVREEKLGATLTSTILPGTPTPLPAEWITSPEQTNGILIGAMLILFVILVGTIVMVFRESSK